MKRDPVQNPRVRLELGKEPWVPLDADGAGVVDASAEFARAGSSPSSGDAF
jgi:hypothetical protein